MGKRQKFEKFFSSVFGSHLDPEDSEILHRKEETDKKLQRIHHLINVEDVDAVSANDKSELAALIEDVHKGYHSLYGRYSHLTENLKKKIKHKKHDNGRLSLRFKSTDSDSSNSGWSDSDDESLSNNHERKTEVGSSLEDYILLQEQLKEVSSENDKLKKELALALEAIGETQAKKDVLENDLHSVRKDLEAIQIENEGLKQKTESAILEKDEREKSLEEFKYEVQQLKDLISALGSEKEALKKALEERTEEVATLHEQLHETREQKEALSVENLGLLSQAQDAEKSMSDLKVATDELSSKIKELSTENESLKVNLEDGHNRENDLTKRLADLQEEIGGHKTELLAFPIKIQMLENSLGDLKNQSELLADEKNGLLNVIDDLKAQLKELEDQNDDLKKDRNESSTVALEEQKKLEILTSEMEEANNRYEVLKLEYDSKIREASELKQILESTEEEKKSVVLENEKLLTKMKLVETELEQLKEENLTLLENQSKLQEKIDNSSAQLEITSCELNDLRKEFGIIVEEKAAIVMELEQSRMDVNVKDQELGKLSEQSSYLEKKLEEKNDEFLSLKNNFDEFQSQAAAQIQEMTAHTNELKAEIEKLSSENSNMRSELELTVMKLGEITKELDQLREENSTLIQTQSTLQAKLDDSSGQREIACTELDDLRKEASVLKEEKVAIVMELELARTNIDAREKELKVLNEQNSLLQQGNEEMNEKSSDLERRLEETIAEVLSLKNSSEEQQKEAAEQTQGFAEQINALQAELDFLRNNKSELESQIVIINEKCAECHASMQDFEDKLTGKILKQENSVAIVGFNFNDLVTHCRQLKHQLQETSRKLDAEEAICRELTSEIKRLEAIRQELVRDREVSRSEKTDTSKEVMKLQNQVSSLEVQLRLALQKLKITESQCKDKENVLKDEVAKLEGANKVLEERIETITGILALSNSALSRIHNTVELVISGVGVKLDELESVFAQKHDCFVSQLSVFITEVSSLKSEMHNQLNEKQEMSQAFQALELRLNKNEEAISALKIESEDLKAHLADRDKQIEQLLGSNAKSGKRLKELEMIVMDKEEEILVRNEEKREAIRQLCLLCDYYRELNDLLFTRLKFKS